MPDENADGVVKSSNRLAISLKQCVIQIALYTNKEAYTKTLVKINYQTIAFYFFEITKYNRL